MNPVMIGFADELQKLGGIGTVLSKAWGQGKKAISTATQGYQGKLTSKLTEGGKRLKKARNIEGGYQGAKAGISRAWKKSPELRKTVKGAGLVAGGAAGGSMLSGDGSRRNQYGNQAVIVRS